MRQKVLGQYLGFFQKLIRSESPAIRLLANVVERGSVTGTNLINLEEEFGLDPWVSSSSQLADQYSIYGVKLLGQKRPMQTMNEKTKTISELIDSLCYS